MKKFSSYVVLAIKATWNSLGNCFKKRVQAVSPKRIILLLSKNVEWVNVVERMHDFCQWGPLCKKKWNRNISIFFIIFEPIRLVLHLKITVWTSVLCKMKNTVGKNMARIGPKWPFILSDSFPIRVYNLYTIPQNSERRII